MVSCCMCAHPPLQVSSVGKDFIKCTDVRMDRKYILEHLKPLVDGLSDDLFLYEREELADAIDEYRDVFSSGHSDIRQTDRVIIRIYARNNLPVSLQPKRFPINKQFMEEAAMQKLMDCSLIEPCQSSWARLVNLSTKKKWFHQILCGLPGGEFKPRLNYVRCLSSTQDR